MFTVACKELLKPAAAVKLSREHFDCFRLVNTRICDGKPVAHTLTIVTPCLNAEATIRRTVESVVGQSTKPYEYLVVDGGSSDGTLQILEEYSEYITSVVSEPDRGISDAFNKGIHRAKGDFVLILNADDWLEPEAVERLMQVIESLPEDERNQTILHCAMNIVDEAGQSRRVRSRYRGGRAGGWAFYFDMPINHPGCCVPKAVYEQLGGYEESFRIAMDCEFVLRSWKNGVQFRYLPEPLVNFAVGGVSTAHTFKALQEVRKAQRKNGLPRLTTEVVFAAKATVNRAKRLVAR